MIVIGGAATGVFCLFVMLIIACGQESAQRDIERHNRARWDADKRTPEQQLADHKAWKHTKHMMKR
jgi:hypothetical protein